MFLRGRFAMPVQRVIRALTLVVMLAAGIGVGAGAMVMANNDPSAQLQACVSSPNGQMRLVELGQECRANEWPVVWNVTGPAGPQGEQGEPGEQGEQGEAGVFSGEFMSPNGLYSITVAEQGIELKGPDTEVSLSGNTVKVSGMIVEVNSVITTSINGGIVTLGCGLSGGLPVARIGDFALVDGPIATISTGSSKAFSC